MLNKKVTTSLLLLVCFFGLSSVVRPGGEAVMYPAANQKNDTYQPGEDWKLAWSDEFQGESINEANWNRLVAKAGRFNEEWQRYTDGDANTYVEDDCLVIKAIHESDAIAQRK